MSVAFRTQPLCAALVLSLVSVGCHQSELLGEDAMNAGAGAGMGAGMSGDGDAGTSGEGGGGMTASTSGAGGAGMGGSGGVTMSPDDVMPDDTSPSGCSIAHASVGGEISCAVTVTGVPYCWGRNPYPDSVDSRPERVDGIMGDVVSISVGANFVCALVEQGYVWCWGLNHYGQLGIGTTDDGRAPALIADLSDVDQIEAGAGHACAIKSNGELWCWGNNESGQIGEGDDRVLTPVKVRDGVAQVSAGWDHTCVRDEDGSVHCAGSDIWGQLGDGDAYPSLGEWVAVDIVATDISAGFEHTCAIDESSEVYCWGDGASGQLGDGTTGEPAGNAMIMGRTSPVLVMGAQGARAVHATHYYSCAVPWMGPTRCWGTNQFGALGYGEHEIGELQLSPVDATLLDHNLPLLAAGSDHRCAILDSGALACWGSNGFGQVGDGTLEDRYEPVTITGLPCE